MSPSACLRARTGDLGRAAEIYGRGVFEWSSACTCSKRSAAMRCIKANERLVSRMTHGPERSVALHLMWHECHMQCSIGILFASVKEVCPKIGC